MSNHKVAFFSPKNMHKKGLSACLLTAMVVGVCGCQTTSGVNFNNNKNEPNQAYLLAAAIKPVPSQLANNMVDAPSVSAMAHKRLSNAFNHFLNAPHFSVSQYKTTVRPFIAKDSVDEGSQSVTKTIMEVLAYQAGKDENDYQDDTFSEYEFDAIEAIYQEHLENNTSLTDDEAWEVAEAIYAAQQHKYDDTFKQNLAQTLLDKLSELTHSYQQMKEESKDESEEESTDSSMASMMGYAGINKMIFDMVYKSPEQVEALQTYTMQYLTTNSVSQYVPSQRQYKSVLSYDFASPTRELSVQIPYKVDFNKASITVDASAAMPLMAMIQPEQTPLPEQQTTHTIEFGLPEEIKTELPTAVLFDAFVNGVAVALNEMNPEEFTPLDISEDTFAKAVNARRAIKVNWGSKQTGIFIGKAMKSMGNSLKQHIDDHPQKYDEYSKLVQILDDWMLMKDDFQSQDVGSLVQVIEAIAPINFDQTQYYYLNGADQLIAKQAKTSIGSDFYGITMDSVAATKYSQKKAEQSPLYVLLTQNFSVNSPAPIDGNAWIKHGQQQEEYEDKAQKARWGYSKADYALSDCALNDSELTTEAVVEGDYSSSLEATEAAAEVDLLDAALEETDADDINSESYRNTAEAFKQFEQKNTPVTK